MMTIITILDETPPTCIYQCFSQILSKGRWWFKDESNICGLKSDLWLEFHHIKDKFV